MIWIYSVLYLTVSPLIGYATATRGSHNTNTHWESSSSDVSSSSLASSFRESARIDSPPPLFTYGQSSFASTSHMQDFPSSSSVPLSYDAPTKGDGRRAPKITPEQVVEKIESMCTKLQEKLYRFALKQLQQPSFSREAWLKFQHENRQEAAKIYEEWRSKLRSTNLLSYYRRTIKKKPDDARLLKQMEKKGFSQRDLVLRANLKRKQESQDEADERRQFTDRLRRLRNEMDAIRKQGFHSRLAYTPRRRHSILSPNLPDSSASESESGQPNHHHYKDENIARMSDIVDLMRSKLRSDPYDPELVPLRDELQGRRQTFFKYFKPIQLPERPEGEQVDKLKGMQAGDSDGETSNNRQANLFPWGTSTIPKKKRTSREHIPQGDSDSGSEFHNERMSSPPQPLLPPGRNYTPEERQQYISSLFDTTNFLNEEFNSD